MPPLRGADLCVNHSPAAREAVTEARRRGGSATAHARKAAKARATTSTAPTTSAEPPIWSELSTSAHALAAAAHVAREVIAGRMIPSAANAATLALRMVVDTLAETDIEARMVAAERMLARHGF